MAVEDTMDPAGVLGKYLDQASPDLLRAMVAQFVTQLMGAEVDALCRALWRRAPCGKRKTDWLPS